MYSTTAGTHTVNALIGFAHESALVGDNIVAVMYLRESNGPGYTDDTWAPKAWSTSNKQEIIASIAQQFNLTSQADLDLVGANITTLSDLPDPEDPAEYLNGLLEGDPLAYAVSSSTDRDAVIALLASAGYKAADIDLEKVTTDLGCAPKAVLTGMAETAELWLADPDLDTAQSEAGAHALAAVKSSELGSNYLTVVNGICPGAGNQTDRWIDWHFPILLPTDIPYQYPPQRLVPNWWLWHRPRLVLYVRVCARDGMFCHQTLVHPCNEILACDGDDLEPTVPCDVPTDIPPVRRFGCPRNPVGEWQPPCAACNDPR